MAYSTQKAAENLNPFEGVFPSRVEFTIGEEITNTKNVAMVFQSGGNPLYDFGFVQAYISDNSDGSTLAATAPSGGWAIGTNGLLLPIIANKYATLRTNVAGLVDVTITETGVDTFYVVVILPDGTQVVSSAVTFT